MKDPAVRVALAISILLGGMFIATLFRSTLATPPAVTSELNNTLSLQHRAQAPLPNPLPVEAPLSRRTAEQLSAISAESSRGPIIVTPMGPPQPVPNLPPHYPVVSSMNSARWGMPKDLMPVVARQAEGPLVHKIVDGDTLRDLAERYLDSADRAGEILEINRDVLSDPKLLPIGVELKIPSRRAEK